MVYCLTEVLFSILCVSLWIVQEALESPAFHWTHKKAEQEEKALQIYCILCA